MGIMMLRCYRADCDSDDCIEAEECAGSEYTKENVKPLFEQQGWTFIKNKTYCWKCSQNLKKEDQNA